MGTPRTFTSSTEAFFSGRRDLAFSIPPVGSIVAWFNGSFATAANGTYTVAPGVTNTVAGANAIIGPCWRVCDGSIPNDVESPIYNNGSKRLPNLTDSRFTRGSTTAGAIGGSATYTPTAFAAAGSYTPAGSSSFSGTAIDPATQFAAAGSYTPSGSVSVTLGNHTHQYGFRFTESFTAVGGLLSPLASGGSEITAYNGAASSSPVIVANSTGTRNQGTVDATESANVIVFEHLLPTAGPSSNSGSGSFSGSGAARSSWFTTNDYTPAGSVSFSGTGVARTTFFSAVATSLEPAFLNVFYIIRIK